MDEPLQDVEAFQMADRVMRVFREAVRRARAESRRLGVPNVYSIDGKRYYELPNGDYVRELPDCYRRNGEEKTPAADEVSLDSTTDVDRGSGGTAG